MKKYKPELMDAENPEWTNEDFAQARPAAEMLPELFGDKQSKTMLKPKRGRPVGATKEQIAVRLDRDVLNYFRSTGPGWQTRMNDALKEWVTTHH